jgi:TolB-like protein
MVVEENCLAQVISMLRRALGEGRGENRYIVTVPRRGYRFVAPVACVDDRACSSRPEETTVAVLPFHNLSARADDERLAAGLVESTLHRLARVPGVRLLARSRPGSRFCVEGSLQRAGARLRVTVKLVDESDDTLVWSQVLDRTSGDVFAVEDEVARRVTGALLQCLAVRARGAAEASPRCTGTAGVA